MKWRYSRKLIPHAKAMRREQMTPAEQRLWFGFLEGRTPRWRNQRPFNPYIADFYFARAKLIVELDGDSHFTPEGRAHDTVRTAYLESLGLKIIRFTNLEVSHNLEGVCWQIEQCEQERLAEFAAEAQNSTEL